MRVLTRTDRRRRAARGDAPHRRPADARQRRAGEPAAHVRARRLARARAGGGGRGADRDADRAAAAAHGRASRRQSTRAISRCGPARSATAARSACSPPRSTACSSGSSARSRASATSSPTPRTSCARPLAVLRAQVELLDRESDPRRRHEGYATLLRRLDEMDRLVDDMLTLASAEAGRLVQPRAIDLGDFFEDRAPRPAAVRRARLPRPTASTGRWRPIPTGSPRCCATSCATPSPTRSRAAASPSSPVRTRAG